MAVPVPDTIKKGLADWSKQLQALPFDYKEWVHVEDFHITLKFLGGLSDKQVEALCKGLDQTTLTFSPFHIRGKSFGFFGRPRSPRVLWGGVEADKMLFDDQKTIDKMCSELGFSSENRPYRPHITVAKKWVGGMFEPSVVPSPPYLFEQGWPVDTIVLYQIHPSRKPKYEPYKIFKFGSVDINKVFSNS